MDVPFLMFKDKIHEVRQLIVSFNAKFLILPVLLLWMSP